MEYLNRMMKAIEYLEDNMDGDIDLKEAAKTTYFSGFHFQRMFHMLTGVTVADYVRRRRLTLAAQELVSSRVKIIDVALKYGYDTPESFSKAFRKTHGMSPSASREPGVSLKMFPRLSFHISLKGDQDMNYKILEKPAFDVVGKGIRVTTRNGENKKIIPKFWGDCNSDGTSDKICQFGMDDGVMGSGMLGICMENEPETEQFLYLIAVESALEDVPRGYIKRTVPAQTWAIFECIGPMPGAIQDLWCRIFTEFFPSTGYEHSGGPEIEFYPPGKEPDESDYRSEVWIPVIKK